MNALALVCLAVTAQGDDPSQRKVEAFRVTGVNVQVALTELFDKASVPAVLLPSVSGRVTVDLEGATVEAVLQTILKQVGGTYRVEGGVYEIVPRWSGACGFEPPVFKVSEGQFDYTLSGSHLVKTSSSTSQVVAEVRVERWHNAVTAHLSTPDGQRRLSDLADLGDYNLTLVPGIRGVIRVPAGFAHRTLRDGLRVLVNGRPQRPVIRLSEYVSVQGYELEETNQGTGETLFSQDKTHLDVSLGRWEYKIRKNDLQIVSFGHRTRF